MSKQSKMVLISQDVGLLAHWQRAFELDHQIRARSFTDLSLLNLPQGTLVWIDLALPDAPVWSNAQWKLLVHEQKMRLAVTSSNPKESEAIAALDAGCAAYCHAFSDSSTLQQVAQVVQDGHIWVGKKIMQRLICSAGHFATPKDSSLAEWGVFLTPIEREVSVLAANGASNQKISLNCNISEKFVKVLLGSVFKKLNLTDRLQLALRVHGAH